MAFAQRPGDLARGRVQGGQARRVVGHALQCLRDVFVHRQQRGQAIGGVGGNTRAQVDAARMALLGQQAVQLELLLVRHEILRLRRGRHAQAVGRGLGRRGGQHAGHDKERHAAHDAFRRTGHRIAHL